MIISPNVAFLAALYFLQGLPYGLQSHFLPLYFRTHGMALSSISLLKLLLTPWMLKALWAPLVDKYGTKRKWLLYSMVGLALSCLMGSCTSPEYMPSLVFILFQFNFLTATQDIAVDGIAIQILTTTELAGGNIAQVVGYKIGSIFSGGLLTWLSEYLSWTSLFICLSFIYITAFLFVYKMEKPDSSEEKEVNIASNKGEDNFRDEGSKRDAGGHYSCDNNRDSWILQHIKQIINTEGTWWIAVFVLLYKLGEQGSLSMTPLFLVDHKMAASSVGFWTGVIGQVISIAGSIMGGWLVSIFRFTPFEVLKFFCQLRLVPLTIQLIVAIFLTDSDYSSISLLYAISVGSMFLMLLGSGAITTATFTMMMYCSQHADPSVQASHYTFIATLEVLGKLTFSVFTGLLTEILEYSLMFLLLVLLSGILIPVLLKCPKVLLEMSSIRQSRNKNH
ncbi:hypothetical protein ACJMK2_044460 [Sinanodonta woodiana]|uniref:Major facilitator superfamily domain-containing protein 3 n=1 Tax=Sinanodonta woodiana TaxID=1069815 RepID=A0ABD3W045_SINWO